MYKKLADFYIEALLNAFNLHIQLTGIAYAHTDGKITRYIKVANTIEDVLFFVDLDVVPYIKGFTSAEEIFDWLMGSKYFNRHFFNELELSLLDEETQNEASKLWDYFHKVGAQSKYRFSLSDEPYLHAADYAFPEARLKQQVYDFTKATLVSLPRIDKININFIHSWYPQLKGDSKKAAELLNEFINAIQLNDIFINYIDRRTPKEVEEEFRHYVDSYIAVE